MESLDTIICALLLCFAVTAGHSASNEVGLSIEKFPFQVSVELDKVPICGGAILGDQWVLTANSCIPLNVSEVHRVKIRAGSNVVGSGGVFHTVSKMARYNFGRYMHTVNYDIGLIKVDVPFLYASTIQWTRPAIDYLTQTDDIEIAGWGLKGDLSSTSIGTSLHSAKVKLLPHAECTEKYEGIMNFTGRMSCLVPRTRLDNACIGDVGSPVIVSGLVSAVVSNNTYCWKHGYPLVVTDIGDAGMFLTFTMAEPILRLF